MQLKDTASGEKFEAVIEPMIADDFKTVKKDKSRFDSFNWNKYKNQEVYKIRLVADETILLEKDRAYELKHNKEIIDNEKKNVKEQLGFSL